MENKEQLADMLYEFSRSVARHWKEVFRERGLSPAPLAILRQVYENPGLTVSEIARRTGNAKSHVSRTVESLEQQGYVVKREHHKDQRLVLIYPTDVVSEGLDPLHREIRSRLARCLEYVPEERLPSLIDCIRLLHAVMNQHAPKEE